MHYLVFDFGGTLTKYAVMDSLGCILEQSTMPASASLDLMLDDIKGVYVEMQRLYTQIKGIAMSIPAVTDADSGCIMSEGALRYVSGVALKALVEDMLHIPVEIENDGNCAALAESYAGAAVNYDSAAVVVCGTGIGGAIIRDKTIQKGANLHSGEFGYGIMLLDSDTLKIGSWSEQGSVGSLVRRVSQMIRKKDRARDGQQTTVTSKLLNGEKVFQMAEDGNSIAIQEVDRYYMVMAMGVHNIQYSLDPEVILLGGGISRRPDFIKKINEKLDRIYLNLSNATVRPKLLCCQHFNDANLLGAYYNFKSRQEKEKKACFSYRAK
jgi:glucokinase